MQDVLAPLTPADYAFLVGLLESKVNLVDNAGLRARLAALEADDRPETRAEMNRLLEREIRYLGSSEVGYVMRGLTGQEPGVPFREIIRDVARALRVDLAMLGTDRELLEALVQAYATQTFGQMSPEQQQRMLEELGVERDKAVRFLKKSAGVFSVPLLIQAFDVIVVQGLIKNIIFGTIARVIGRQLSARLFTLLAGRLPWWITWIGPAAWTLSIGWTVLDLQGPALRKTVPVVLYLGLVSMRAAHAA